MKVKCEVCGKKFKKAHGLSIHKIKKHPSLPQALAIAPPIGEVEEVDEKDGKDKVIERLLDILWMSLTVDQKQQAILNLQLDE